MPAHACVHELYSFSRKSTYVVFYLCWASKEDQLDSKIKNKEIRSNERGKQGPRALDDSGI